MENKEIVYPLKIDKKIWEQFKEIVPRRVTLNLALIALIGDKIAREKNK